MSLEQFDLPILRFATSFVGRSDLFDHLMFALERYDLFNGVAMMSLLWLAWFYRPLGDTPKQQDKRQSCLLIVFGASLVAVVLSRVFQLVLHIHRRPILEHPDFGFPSMTNPAIVSPWNSFPSDHAVLFFALAVGLWRGNRRIGAAALLWSVIIVSLPRIYLGIHYPSDIVAGALLGIIIMLVCARLPLQNGATRVLAWGKIHPGVFFWIAFLATEETAHLFDDFRDLAHAVKMYFTGGD